MSVCECALMCVKGREGNIQCVPTGVLVYMVGVWGGRSVSSGIHAYIYIHSSN